MDFYFIPVKTTQGGEELSKKMSKSQSESPIVFLNTGWMTHYQGVKDRGSLEDSISGGGSFVEYYGFGYEAYNFKPYKGVMYGFFEPMGSEEKRRTIRIERLGSGMDDDHVDGVTVVWVASDPEEGGTFIVGWYKNATIYRNMRRTPDKKRVFMGDHLEYCVRANQEDCKLLLEEERIFQIPRGRGGMGHANIWYADNNPGKIKENVRSYIINGGKIQERKSKVLIKGISRQSDPFKRQRIEKKAVDMTRKHFENIGFTVKSFEKDNLGWDLEATRGKNKLRIEVKGLSQEILLFELTPNEYEKSQEFIRSYRISVVTNALTKKPTPHIFSFSKELDKWIDQKGITLHIEEKTSARMSASMETE